MKKEKAELIELRLNRAEESFEMIKLCVEEKFWNSAATHLYYTCFYLIQALFAEKELGVKTHRGLKLIFAQHFINTQQIDPHWGKLLSKLFALRQMSDYGDISTLMVSDILPLFEEVTEFKNIVYQWLQTNN